MMNQPVELEPDAELTLFLIILMGGVVREDDVVQAYNDWVSLHGEPTRENVRAWAYSPEMRKRRERLEPRLKAVTGQTSN